MERSKKNQGLYMVLSVIIAIGLWIYVRSGLNLDETTRFNNLPVTFSGVEVLESRGLMLVDDNKTVRLTVSGKWDTLKHLTAEDISVVVDVSNVQQPGEYTLAYRESFDLPSSVSGSSLLVTDRSPANVTFTVARRVTRSVPVRGSFTGSVADGYQAGEFSFSPSSIQVSGEESVVNQIDYALVTLDQEELAATYSSELPYTLITYTGEALDLTGKLAEANVGLVQATLPVSKLKKVDLKVNLIPGGGITADTMEDHVTCEITPASIMVSGEEDDLEPLSEILLGDIDLSKVLGSETLTFSIPLAAEFTNVSGVSEATVKIQVRGLTTATMEVENILCINVPSGYRVDTVTTSRQVQIRGTAEAVAGVSPTQIRLVANLENAAAATGTQTIPAKVYLDDSSGAVGVVGEYSIVVSITRG